MSTIYPIGTDQGDIIINKLTSIADALNDIETYGITGASNFYEIASQSEAEEGVDNSKIMTPLRVAQAITSLGAEISALDLKAPLASPALTGIPTAPTPLSEDNSTQIATTAFVQNKIAALENIIQALSLRITTLESNASSPSNTEFQSNIDNDYLILTGNTMSESNDYLTITSNNANVSDGYLQL